MTDLSIAVEEVSAGNLNILGGYIIRHCEEIVHMNMCLLLDSYRDRAAGIHQYVNTVSGNKKREITYCYDNFNLKFKYQICIEK
jgi:hypothetical protein